MEYYYKLGGLIVDGCPKPLRELFMQEARTDTRRPYTTLSDFLWFHRMLIKQWIRFESQRDLLYPPSGTSVDITKWDVSLLCTLVQNLFPDLPYKVLYWTSRMQNIRNRFQHISATDKITSDEFTSMWGGLDSGIMAVTNHLTDTSYRQTMTDFIQDLKDRPLSLTGSNFDEMIARLEELKSFTSDVHFSAGESHKILKRAASKSMKRSGKIVKRINVEDTRIKHMKGLMATMIRNSLPDDFDPPREAFDIERKLQEQHRIVVCGQDSTVNIHTALYIIKKMNYNLDRSVVMKKPSDWDLICHEDVDLTLYLDPFGGPSGYRHNLADKSAGVFSSMVDASREDNEDVRIDTIIVTDARLLHRFKQNTDHEMTADTAVCTVGAPLEQEELSEDEGHECDMPSCTLCPPLDQSQAYINYWSRVSDNKEDFNKAKRLLQEERIICITGAQSSNRAILAANLLSESSRRCLVLCQSNDMHHVATKYLSYLLIKDFGGHGKFDPTIAQGWYSQFDVLFPMVQQRRVGVVLVCETSILAECIHQLGRHDILDEKYILHLQEQPQSIVDAVDVRPGTSTKGHDTNNVPRHVVPSNQSPTQSGQRMPPITKNTVVLEGGGEFEEGQAYLIRDKHGNAMTMIWSRGEFSHITVHH